MLSVMLVRSLVLGETINNPIHGDVDDEKESTRRRRRRKKKTTTTTMKSKTPLLIFIPTKEIVTDTYRLATIARDLGMDLHPTPSLSHVIFSYPSSSPSSSSSLWSSTSSSSLLSLPNNAIPLPFPSLSSSSLSSLSLLRSFVTLSNGLFKLVFIKHDVDDPNFENGNRISNWDCCTLALISRFSGERIDTMDGFSQALAGKGWTLYKTKENPSPDSGQIRMNSSAYLFRKMDPNRVRVRRVNGEDGGGGGGGGGGGRECRMRELRLPLLDFRNAPLRILQYILLMTDDVFYLA